MKHTTDRWGERTVLRIAFDENTEKGIEVILRATGERRRFEPEEIAVICEKVIQALYGDAPAGLSTFRAVSTTGDAKKPIQPMPFTDAEREMLRCIISGLRKRLDPGSIKELKSFLDDIVRTL